MSSKGLARRAVAAIGVAAAAFVVWAALPHVLPTRIALGPCGKDWTSPTSFLPRASPTRSATVAVGPARVKVCYGSPSARGRKIFGGLVPWGELWRLGANEPTRLFVSAPVDLAGIRLPAGRYSLYAIPRPDEWEIFVSRSTFHWGNDIGPAVRAREVGSLVRPSSKTASFVEQLRIDPEETEEGTGLAIEWERTRVTLPLR